MFNYDQPDRRSQAESWLGGQVESSSETVWDENSIRDSASLKEIHEIVKIVKISA